MVASVYVQGKRAAGLGRSGARDGWMDRCTDGWMDDPRSSRSNGTGVSWVSWVSVWTTWAGNDERDEQSRRVGVSLSAAGLSAWMQDCPS